MKKNVIGIFALVLILASCSDSKTTKEQQIVTSKTINGVLTVDVTTVKDGVKTHEVFKGKAGEAKLKEFAKDEVDLDSPSETEETKESKSKKVEMVNENGKKTLTIEETKNGKTTKETYTGEDADRKMREIETEEESTRNVKMVEKKTIKE